MLSVIIPTYGRANDLKATVKSILNQSLEDFEIIIVDNEQAISSSDQVTELVQQEKKIHYVQIKLSGVTYARSIGNLLATGEIILQIDDDVSLLDVDCLKKIVNLFKSSEIDVIGVLELHSEADVESFLAKQSVYSDGDMINQFENTKIGQLGGYYNITTGFEKLLDQPQGIYPIQSFRSCFMAYRKSVLSKLKNWDSNYCTVGSRIGVREETDFLLRCRNAGYKIYYTNITAIWHRAGDRDKSLIVRERGIKRHFYYAAGHSYMAMKDMIETGQFLKIIPWFIYQMLWGSYKNPGLFKVIYHNHSLSGSVFNIMGFIGGILFALSHKRKILTDFNNYINTLEP